jgi:hypothetical protein
MRWVITVLGVVVILTYGVLSGSLRLPTVATRSLTTLTPAPGQGDHMALGASYTRDGSGYAIVQPKDSFHAKDALAFVVSLDHPFGTTHLTIILAKVGAGGADATVGSAPLTTTNPSATQLADRYETTDDLVGNSPAGTYKLEIAEGHSILAQATFHYVR